MRIPILISSHCAIVSAGLSGYALSKCLKEVRKQREQEEDVEEERLKYRQYEQPGELVTLPSGEQRARLSMAS